MKIDNVTNAAPIEIGHEKSEPESPLQKTRVIWMMAEGKRTEPDYYSRLKQSYFNGKVEFHSIRNDGIEVTTDTNNTNRSDMISISEDYISFARYGKCTAHLYVTQFLNNLWIHLRNVDKEPVKSLMEERRALHTDVHSEHNRMHPAKENKANNYAKLQDEAHDLFSKLTDELVVMLKNENNALGENGFLDETGAIRNLDEDQIATINTLLESNDHLKEILRDTAYTGKLEFTYYKPNDKEFDEMIVVMDRDKDDHWENLIKNKIDRYGYNIFESRSDEMYEKHICRCTKLGYRLIISNPCFELWLLLHHDVSTDPKYFSNVSKVEYKLNTKEGRARNEKAIDDVRFRFYGPNIEKAIKNAENMLKPAILKNGGHFDLRLLINNPGTNVGRELRRIHNLISYQ